MNSFFYDLGIWIHGMLLILIIYHTSAYFFTKDKSFALFTLFLILLFIYTYNLVDNPIANKIKAHFSFFFASTPWLLHLVFWVVNVNFFLYFLEIKKTKPTFYIFIKRYFNIFLIVGIVFYVIDFIFFKQQYFFEYFYTKLFATISAVIGIYTFVFLLKIKNPLNPIFVFGFFFFLLISYLYLINQWFPLPFLTTYISSKNLYLFGIFIMPLIVSVGISLKYQFYRKERDLFNQQLLVELQEKERIEDQANQELLNKVNKMRIELEIASKKNEKLKLAQITSRFKNEINSLQLSSLLSHMNSHFLFNTLNSIKLFIVENNTKKAVFYINKFSKLIRKFLEASTEKEITLKDELDTIKLYTSVENIRFNEEINFIFENENNTTINNVIVPPLMLQPFVENAIWHGLSSKKDTKKLLIKTYKQDHFVIVVIDDNGIGREAASKIEATKNIKRTGFGINATKDRLTNFYQERNQKYYIKYVDLFDANKKPKGTKVILKLPIST